MPNAAQADHAEMDKPAPGRTTTWWQWVLVYPTLAISLAGSMPELIGSLTKEVPFGKSADADEQNRLWRANIECAKNSGQIIRNRHNVEIGSVVCDSGDVLLKGKLPDADDYAYRWVSWNTIAPPAKTALSLVGTAHAAERPGPAMVRDQGPSVVCQRWVGNGQLLRRLSINKACVDEVVNTYNGRVIRRNPAPCQPSC
jgi:hypothetical protein